jgi:hypothetical protein
MGPQQQQPQQQRVKVEMEEVIFIAKTWCTAAGC